MSHISRLKRITAGIGISLITLTTAGVALSDSAYAAQTMTPTTHVNMRSGPGMSHGVLLVLSPSESVTATGQASGVWRQVTTKSGQTGWASGNYLRDGGASSTTTTTTASAVKPATSVSLPGYAGLKPNARAALQRVLDKYPEIRTIGGQRASSAYSSDHPNGRAIDVMIPSWGSASGVSLGDRIAADFQANAGEFNITYIIWRQKQWTAAYPQRGWRVMADRGSATANHYDHVHISFKA